MEEQINDILRRRGALHVINGHRMYSEESVKCAIKEALQQVEKFDLADVVGQSEQLPCELCGGSGFIHDDYIGTGICSCCDD